MSAYPAALRRAIDGLENSAGLFEASSGVGV
jgi:hypothetical protein